MERLQLWILDAFAEELGGKPRGPGGSQAFIDQETNGTTLTVISGTDSFDVYQGKNSIYAFHVSAPVMLRMARFVIWDWWVKATWCGLKLRLWNWALRRSLRG